MRYESPPIEPIRVEVIGEKSFCDAGEDGMGFDELVRGEEFGEECVGFGVVVVTDEGEKSLLRRARGRMGKGGMIEGGRREIEIVVVGAFEWTGGEYDGGSCESRSCGEGKSKVVRKGGRVDATEERGGPEECAEWTV